MNPSCLTCRHSEPESADQNEMVLQCRRYPPTLHYIDNEPAVAFPQVFEGDYCGEYTPTNNETP